MYERVTEAYVADPAVRQFFERSNPWALRSIAERLLEADERGMWDASDVARKTLHDALLEAEGWEEDR
jgi:cobaltochelatase CobN